MGEILEKPGRRAEVKVARDELVLFEFRMAPRTDGASPHFHKQHVDSFYVLEGEVEFTLESGVVTAGPGTFVSAPPGTLHGFGTRGPGRARVLNVHAPDAGFANSLRRQ